MLAKENDGHGKRAGAPFSGGYCVSVWVQRRHHGPRPDVTRKRFGECGKCMVNLRQDGKTGLDDLRHFWAPAWLTFV